MCLLCIYRLDNLSISILFFASRLVGSDIELFIAHVKVVVLIFKISTTVVHESLYILKENTIKINGANITHIF